MSVQVKTLAAARLLGGAAPSASAVAIAAIDGQSHDRFLGKPDQGLQELLMEKFKKDWNWY